MSTIRNCASILAQDFYTGGGTVRLPNMRLVDVLAGELAQRLPGFIKDVETEVDPARVVAERDRPSNIIDISKLTVEQKTAIEAIVAGTIPRVTVPDGERYVCTCGYTTGYLTAADEHLDLVNSTPDQAPHTMTDMHHPAQAARPSPMVGETTP